MEKTDLKKCHICGCYDYSEAKKSLSEEDFCQLEADDLLTNNLVKCEYCDKWVCDATESETCGEVVNEDCTYCNSCVQELGKVDCSKCKTLAEDCWCSRRYNFIIGDCPTYIPIEGTDNEKSTT